MKPDLSTLAEWTDHYFLKTQKIIQHFGDQQVTYAVFMRRPVISAPRLAMEWLYYITDQRNIKIDFKLNYQEGEWVGAGEPILYFTGSFSGLVDLETIFLQKLGPSCVAAFNAYTMCTDLPYVGFLAMDARHCAGLEMAELMAYGASVGSKAAQIQTNAKGFIGNATQSTAHYFGQDKAFGTMPHAFVGYAGSTLKAAEMFHKIFPDEQMVVLVDYFGHEITDSLDVCRHFTNLAQKGLLGIRLDTHGSRYVEGLDPTSSYRILDRFVPQSIRGYRTELELKYLIGGGVSAAAIFHVREALNQAGFDKVKLIASSGFDPLKCKIMATTNAPIDIIGTGSFLPQQWPETYATADIVMYNQEKKVKIGREFLLEKLYK
ncbi:MAG: nicotinate phosphoribosyltransferase [Alphaproteobacteria bacterium]|nr:nicotinate phosphoribosyltransferase [Alphaproteobacteria bacterium]